MQLTFLGTGTSAGIPNIGCRCPVCTSPDPRNKRLRTSALLRTGSHTILIDAGPDFRAQALANGIDHLDAVLITHSHYDHVGGLDDLRPITPSGGAIPIYANQRTLQDIRERFSYAFVESSDGSTRPSLDLRPVEHYTPFTVANAQGVLLEVIPFDVWHGTWEITGYRFGRLGYVTDASRLPPPSRDLLRSLDLLVLNALRPRPHPTHFTLEQALDVVADLRPQRAFFVHMSHAVEHAAIDAELPPGVALAYDGLTVEVAA